MSGKNTISANRSNFGALEFKTQFLNWETDNFRGTFFLNSDFSEICNILRKTWIKFLFIEDFHQEKTDLFPSQAAVACQTSEALPAL